MAGTVFPAASLVLYKTICVYLFLYIAESLASTSPLRSAYVVGMEAHAASGDFEPSCNGGGVAFC